MIYNITDEPTDVVYRELVKFLSKTASCFLFVKFPQISLEEEGQHLMRLLLPPSTNPLEIRNWKKARISFLQFAKAESALMN
jgi:hypothetical protein